MSCQQLNIQISESEHSAMLFSTVTAWTEKEADMYLVSEEGDKVYTHRNLISFYSSMASDIVKHTSAMVGISVPASSDSLVKMLKVLTGGTARAAEKSDLEDVARAGELLGISLQNMQIGPEKTSFGRECEVGKYKNTVLDSMLTNHVELSVDHNNLKQFDSSEEFLIDGSAEVDYLDEDSNILEVSLSEVKKSPLKAESEKKLNLSVVSDKVVCKDCGQKFSSKTGLFKHMKLKHTDQKSKPFKCDSCDKRFAYASSLVSHKLLHTVGKPYECEFCEYAAAQKGNLKTHRLSKHKDRV